MNTAYLIAAILTALALFLGYLGMGIVTDKNISRFENQQGAWVLAPAVALLITALIFAGVGVDIQYK